MKLQPAYAAIVASALGFKEKTPFTLYFGYRQERRNV
jgi:hypothetical protein